MNWQNLMQIITEKYNAILGSALVGVYLHGSAAFGCATSASDLDFIVVVDRELSQQEKENLLRVLLELEKEAPAKGFEMSVVLLSDCLHFSYPTPYQFHYSQMHRLAAKENKSAFCQRMKGKDYDLAAHFTVIRTRGIPVFGRATEQVFGEVPFSCYLDSIWRDVCDAQQEIEDHSLYLVLNLCRVWAAFQQGLVLSKSEGAKWANEFLPKQLHPIVDDALAAYLDGKNFCCEKERLHQFTNFILRKIDTLRLKEAAAGRYNTGKERSCLHMMIGEKWSKIEIYNEYLKKIPNLLSQINTVEKMQLKAQTELEMLKKEEDNFSRQQYQARLLSTMEQCGVRLQEMTEELRLIQGLKEQLEAELGILRVQK